MNRGSRLHACRPDRGIGVRSSGVKRVSTQVDWANAEPVVLSLELLTGSRRALEAYLADEVRAQRGRDPLAPFPVVVGGTLMRPYLRRRLAELTGGHLNVRLMTVGELGLRLATAGSCATGAGRCRSSPIASWPSRWRSSRRGYFEPVAAMPGFPAVLLRTLRELRGAGVDAASFGAAAARCGPDGEAVGAGRAVRGVRAAPHRVLLQRGRVGGRRPAALGADRLSSTACGSRRRCCSPRWTR